ncbi:MAG: hypothetical protein A3B70_04255 [Deltaproteobacteria bacterium RIFCSPHIGHO2_02_FULL_40_11]|nr:MAG: hypothetical protein A3B70_04255 [Deltaproteobacteria bacterium RIFCSPHIGHO2_02_FULL_40_11]
MVSVHPFKALHYHPKHVTLKKVCVPPYDVISNDEKKKFLKQSPYNFSRIILGKDKTGYKTASRRFQSWQDRHILIQDEKEGFYFWEQTFLFQGKKVVRSGLMCGVSLHDFFKGGIRPHENTFEAPKSDRMEILKACQANLTPIFMMYDDPKKVIEKKILPRLESPVLRMTDAFGVKHRIWKIEALDQKQEIQKVLSQKNLYILDGHHRFATALKYYTQHKKQNSAHAVMSFITNLCSPGLKVYAIDRILPFDQDFSKGAYLKKLQNEFKIQQSKKRVQPGIRKWVIRFSKDPIFYVLKPKNLKKIMASISNPKVIRDLDVAILHEKIIPSKIQSNLKYLRGMPEYRKRLFKEVSRGQHSAIWMCAAPNLKQLKAVSDAALVMPAKSTYFYPKLLSGLLIRPFNEV